ncbi:GNAT family N-acetyltransferase [Acetobacterium tundrae]|uniref:GNAT family N-acetyltransferase n=2 Tax=Acetobacterium tundrae TaxID=132932 RepID=A0ABR6WG00_9FIRM|nr:GNAT family N-acetyltransferase [Acetobacterium tundrae]
MGDIMETIHEGKNKFYIGADEDDPIAQVNFSLENENKIVIEHVYVSRELREQGIGKILVEKMVDYAKEEHKKITSRCSYADKILAEDEKYTDVYEQ